MVAACGGDSHPASSSGRPSFPETGLALLSLNNGEVSRTAPIGSDLVAVLVSGDGSTAYLADSAPGDVYAVALPSLSVTWKQHTGGAPFGLLLHNGRLVVSLYDDASVAELDPATGAIDGTFPTVDHPGAMTVDTAGHLVVAGSGDYGTATVGGDVWMADYQQHQIFDLTHPRRVALPLPVAPFWLSPGANGRLLIAAEGAHEDTDPGAVLSYSTMSGTFTTLATPRDPDQVIESGSTILIAAHGDHEVLAIKGGTAAPWARGAAAVAVAADPPLNFVVVVVNSHE